MISPPRLERVLIIKLWALGDILMATPVIDALRSANPDVRITWIVDSSHAELLRGHPGIDELIALDSAFWRRLLRRGNVLGWLREGLRWRRDLSRRRFDVVINCQPEKSWTFFLCAARKRIGLFYGPRPGLARLLYHIAVPRPKTPERHNSHHYLDTVRRLGISASGLRMSLGETPEEAAFAAEFRERNGIAGDSSWVVIAPFSTADNRTLEKDFCASLAAWLRDERGDRVVILGAEGDREAAESIGAMAGGKGIIIAAGLPMRQFIALIRTASLVICTDSSPMHIAAAVDTPYVAIFGPTPVSQRAPLAGRGTIVVKPIPCAPCDKPVCANPIYKQCIRHITLEEAQTAIDSRLPRVVKKT